MASRDKIRVEIEGIDRASAPIERVESRFRSFGNFLARSFVITLGDVTRAVGTMIRAFGDTIRAAAVQEEAMNRLRVAVLGLAGGSEELVQKLIAQASALQKVSKFGDETTIATQALLANIGVQADQLEGATRAAVGLSEAFGLNLETAARQVGMTLSGTAGRLARLIPELNDLSPSALKAGAAIDLLDAKLGSLPEKINSFAERSARLANAWSDVQEAIGTGITANEELGNSLTRVSEVLERNTGAVEDNSRAFFSFLSGAGARYLEFLEAWARAADSLELSLDRYAGKGAEVQISQDALAASAERLGITVEELRARIEANVTATRNQDAASRAAAVGLQVQTDATTKAAVSVKGLADAYASAVDSAQAFGEVTSVQLEAKIIEIALALENQRQILGEQSAEWQRLRVVAEEQIESIQARVASLRQGLGDLKEGVEEATESFGEFTEEQREAGRENLRYAATARQAAAAQASFNAQIGAFAQPGLSAGHTAENQRLIDRAVAAGNRPILGGTRIRLVGGGSRLIGSGF